MNEVSALPVDFIQELDRLAQMPETDVNHLQNMPAFLRFVELCQTRYPHVKSGSMLRFSLASALQQLGLACLVGGRDSRLAASAADVSAGLDKAIRSTASRRLHLCPLDLASRLPTISFGPNQVRCFSGAEIEQLFDVPRLHRVNKNWSFDSGRFSQFNWLVVSEEVRHDDMGPEGRRLPGLFIDLSQDFGRIEPYKTGLPPSVEAALFGLLTIPWERLGGLREMEWRGFVVPWVYTLDSDVFARRVPPPSPDSLSWEPVGYIDANGDEHEYERPVTYPLDDGNDDEITWLNDSAWGDVVSARKSTLFARPVAHFFIRGFQAEGIDEFLAHIATIEAALGSPIDHNAKKRPRIGGPKQGATHRVCLRISGLLGDATFGTAYGGLFGLRSDFLHGKPMGDISGQNKRTAREIARKVVCALIGAAVSRPSVDRDHFLADLLDTGARLDPQMNSVSKSKDGTDGR